MMRSFTVTYSKREDNERVDIYILGVTSIFPNLNGVLIQCEKRNEGQQIDSHTMKEFGIRLNIEYSTEEDVADYIRYAKEDPVHNRLIDGRE